MPKEPIYSIPKAAEYCGLNRVTLWKYVKAGKITSFRTPGGQYRIHKKDLIAFMKQKGMYPFPAEPAGQLKILIVDDDKQIQKLLSRTLNKEGVAIECASNGYEAGFKIRKFQPRLVILDLVMPGLDGFEVCEMIKQGEDTADIRIIAISGYDTAANRDRILEAGADLFLPKPLDLKKLKKEIKAMFEDGGALLNFN